MYGGFDRATRGVEPHGMAKNHTQKLLQMNQLIFRNCLLWRVLEHYNSVIGSMTVKKLCFTWPSMCRK
jgi:hypothetical protein